MTEAKSYSLFDWLVFGFVILSVIGTWAHPTANDKLWLSVLTILCAGMALLSSDE